jgi:hypothetical protein
VVQPAAKDLLILRPVLFLGRESGKDKGAFDEPSKRVE